MTGARALPATFRAKGPLVLLSILLHVAILVPIGLAIPKLVRPDPADFEVLTLDLTPVVIPRISRTAPSVPRSAVSGRTASPPSPPRLRAPSTAATGIEAPAAVTAEGPAIEERWRVHPGPGRVARIPCPAAPGDRLGQRVCLTGSAMNSPDMPERLADHRRPGSDGMEQAREDGFERQRQANENWRDYTRGEGAYPGLRSLFSER